jgi:hypothetical protein
MRKFIDIITEGSYPINLGQVFHGSQNEFSIIDPSKSRAGLGSYVTPNRDFASEFGPYILEGELFASHVMDISECGPFIEEDDLDVIASELNHDYDALLQAHRSLIKSHGDAFTFNVLELSGFTLQPGEVVAVEDWGQGSGEPAFVFADPHQFVVKR